MNNLLIGRDRPKQAARARAFWAEFTSNSTRPRFAFGRNVYTQSIAQSGHLDGVIDDFSTEATFVGLPVLRTAALPKDAMVIAAAGGRPLTVRRLLNDLGVEHLDYFSLVKWAAPDLRDVVFNEGFTQEFEQNRTHYDWAYQRLADEASREAFRKLVSFRLSYDLDDLEGFTERQKEQYFEDFLSLQPAGEAFVDVGCFDGYTSLEFIKRCPGYSKIYAFEPDPSNHARCVQSLGALRDVLVFPYGAGAEKATYRFAMGDSASTICEAGEVEISVDRLDEVLSAPPTFIKIDTEGYEAPALAGARRLIAEHGPSLAVSVYHKPGDFWRIPKLVLEIRSDYDVYLRHYTESIYETVMFFVRRDKR